MKQLRDAWIAYLVGAYIVGPVLLGVRNAIRAAA